MAFHCVALVCELGMIGNNIATVAVIQEGDGGSSEGRSRQAQMIYIAGSIMLTVLVCIANVIGIRSIMQAMLKAVRRLSHHTRSTGFRSSGALKKSADAVSRAPDGACKAMDAAQLESWQNSGGAAPQPEGCTAAEGGGCALPQRAAGVTSAALGTWMVVAGYSDLLKSEQDTRPMWLRTWNWTCVQKFQRQMSLALVPGRHSAGELGSGRMFREQGGRLIMSQFCPGPSESRTGIECGDDERYMGCLCQCTTRWYMGVCRCPGLAPR